MEIDKGSMQLGIIVSASYIVEMHDQPVIARNLLEEHDITKKVAEDCGADEYDMNKLEGLWAGE